MASRPRNVIRRGVKRSAEHVAECTNPVAEPTHRPNTPGSMATQSKDKTGTPKEDIYRKFSKDAVKIYQGPVVFAHPSIIGVLEDGCEPCCDDVRPRLRCPDQACAASHYHCALCPTDLPYQTTPEDAQRHFTKIHTKNSFHYSEHVVVLCNLSCDEHLPSHYHCPKCGEITVRTLHMRSHLDRCTSLPQEVRTDSSGPPMRKRGRVRLEQLKTSVQALDADSVWDGHQQDKRVKSEIAENEDEVAATRSVMVSSPTNIRPESSPNTTPAISTKLFKIPALDRYILLETGAGASVSQSDLSAAIAEATDLQVTDRHNSDTVTTATNQETMDTPGEALIDQAGDSDTLNVNEKDDEQPGNMSNFGQSSTSAEITELKLEEHEALQVHEVKDEEEALSIINAIKASQPDEDMTSGEGQDHSTTDVLSQALTPHVSIVANLLEIECNRCQTCCDLFHCPLCPKALYKPHVAKKLRDHLRRHFRVGVQYLGLTSMKCNLTCTSKMGSIAGKAHWHCPLCPQTKLHRSRLREHLENHARGKTRQMNSETNTPSEISDGLGTAASMVTAPNNRDVVSDYGTEMPVHPDESLELMETMTRYSERDQTPDDTTAAVSSAKELAADINEGDDEESEKPFREESAAAASTMAETSEGTQDPPAVIRTSDEDSTPGLCSVTEPGMEPPTNCHTGSSDDAPKGRPVVFELVAGLISQETTSVLKDVMGPVIPRLGQLAGVVATQQDPDKHSYMLQGTWEAMDKTKLILEILEQHAPQTEEEMENVLAQICKEHPEKLAEAENIEYSREDGLSQKTCPDAPFQPDAGEVSSDTIAPWIDHEKPCPYCARVFRYRLSLFHHIGLKHDVSMPPKLDATVWNPILSRMNVLKEPNCPQCGKNFKQLLHAKIHYGTLVCQNPKKKPKHLDDAWLNPTTGLFECHLCEYKTKIRKILEQHFDYKHRERTLQCDQCPKRFSTGKILASHFKSVHGKVRCEICSDMVNPNRVVEHLNKHKAMPSDHLENPVPATFKCNLCEYCTTSTELFDRHCKRSHTKEKLACEECTVEFDNVVDFRRHCNEEHGQDGNSMDNRENCPICDKNMLKKNVMAHVRLKHQGVRRYKCTTCNKTFQTKYVLDKHKQIHLLPEQRQYQYICWQCNMGFQNKTLYKEHKYTHSNQRPYVCPVCKNCFRQKTVLVRHMLIHKSTQYACDICQRVYKTKHNLQQHRKRHNRNDVVFMCPCKNVFGTNEELEQHQEQCSSAARGADQQQRVDPGMDASAAGVTMIIQTDPETPGLSQDPEGTGDHFYIIEQPPDQESLVMSHETLRAETCTEGDVMTPVLTEGDVMTPVLADLVSVVSEPANLPVTESYPSTETNDRALVAIEAQDLFQCGYCNMAFNDLDVVHAHIIKDHIDLTLKGKMP